MTTLELARRFVSRSRLPGRYILAEVAAKLFAPPTGVVEANLGSYRVAFDFGDLIQRQVYFGLYDQAETELLRRILGSGDIFLDLGANVGYYSLIASQIVGPEGRVHAFEPIGQNARVLTRTIAENGISNITVNEVAVGAEAGSLDLFVPDGDIGNSGWASIVPSERRPRTITVEMVAIDDYLAAQSVDRVRLVKMDIEGGELNALRGMERLLRQADAPDLLCEVNPFLLEKLGLGAGSLGQLLDKRGYLLYEVGSSGLKAIDPHDEIVRQINVFGTKDVLRRNDGTEDSRSST
ncbi:MAG TPA: FkbM family methyltransferase [Anaerolineae bacterium]|nr:FkbM family methyltransferase [Anaerolineae bacterium]